MYSPVCCSAGMEPSQIPDSLYSNWNYYRIGGAQMEQGGWITGQSGYKGQQSPRNGCPLCHSS